MEIGKKLKEARLGAKLTQEQAADELLKGDTKMLEHLEESTDIVKSNQKLILAVAANIVVFLACLLMAAFLPESAFMIACVFCLAVASITFLMYQIVKKI